MLLWRNAKCYKKNLIIIKSIIVWKWNHLFTKNYFRKKKINCYGFMPSNFQVICGPMVSENRRSPASTETPVHIPLVFFSIGIYKVTMDERPSKLIIYLSCCHCNVSSLLAQNSEAYNSLYSHDFICISGTYFDSTIFEGDRSLQLNSCNLIRADHTSNTKQGGVCIY